MKPVYALVDCNNFYVSCERLFKPQLKKRPVIVLSNNDGCVVSRSQEAKALGVSMAAPLFKVRDLVERHQIEVFSSNYALYADISARVMHTLEELSPEMEIYSIDEAFLNLAGFNSKDGLHQHGQHICHTLYQHVGVPVCVGIAPTKTLAKLANYGAKHYPATGGVVDLMDQRRQKKLLHITPVGEIWGVGRRSTLQLQNMGINTALQLVQMPLQTARRRFSIVMERTIRELNGEPCIELDNQPAAKQQILCSRSFGQKITDYDQLRETVCEFAARAAEKLRQGQQMTQMVNVSIRTSPFDAHEPCYANSATAKLSTYSNDSREIVALATQLLKSIWKEDYRYAKAGVMLGDLCLEDRLQPGLFDDPQQRAHSRQLMQAIDQINHSGRGKVWLGGQRPQQDWFMNRAHLSPAYTTRWEDLPQVF
ncbi:MAG: translesion error-prone DNA polymerase V subunit UmuC [Desulfuromonas sp.]|nr:translesion error-prone DNA polymerase V subunit UmuC [Desulfuromonas sp.]